MLMPDYPEAMPLITAQAAVLPLRLLIFHY